MLSINTNISSIVAQRSMTTSTTKLNQAIERLSTGSKINHAADNAANYSIAKNMSTQLSACDVAADNIAMGMDLLSVAQDTIAGMQDRGSRIHALITQARNGTYGTDSLNAMTQEAQALVSEINRLYKNTEYNGKNIFKGDYDLPDWAQEVKATAGTIDGKSLEQCAAEHNGFIQEVVEETPDVTVTNPIQLADAISSNTKIGIGNAETLAKLAELVNSGTTCEGKTIILTENVDLSAYRDDGGWNPIGTESNRFQGTFNGNGHKVTGLYINRAAETHQGLFGVVDGDIKNVGIEGYLNLNTESSDCVGGLLVGWARSNVDNCYAKGNVSGQSCMGGLIGVIESKLSNCYAEGNVFGQYGIGGLAFGAYGDIENCYSIGNVTATAHIMNNSMRHSYGGLVGCQEGDERVTNCYSIGDVTGYDDTGGLVGNGCGASFSNCYVIGDVTCSETSAGIVGEYADSIDNCYFIGNLIGDTLVSGISCICNSVSNCFVVGTVEGEEDTFVFDSAGSTVNTGIFRRKATSLQVGINGDEDSQINVDTNMGVNLAILDLTSDSAYKSITNFLNKLSEKSTQLGAAQNRLESALESNMVQMDNLTSSLSTIRDADISEVSSDFIRQQILQQACATLMSTANQSPSIALQLL